MIRASRKGLEVKVEGGRLVKGRERSKNLNQTQIK